MCEAATQTKECIIDIKAELIEARNCIADLGNDVKIAFLLGSLYSYGSLHLFYKYLGPGVHCLLPKQSDSDKQSKLKWCSKRALPPTEVMFLTLVYLRLGLMEQDLAY